QGHLKALTVGRPADAPWAARDLPLATAGAPAPARMAGAGRGAVLLSGHVRLVPVWGVVVAPARVAAPCWVWSVVFCRCGGRRGLRARRAASMPASVRRW